jgi:hypothetical protein
MNTNGRIHAGLRYSHKKSIQGKMKIDSVMKTWRRRLGVKHNPQYFLLRQKTPPIMTNTPEATAAI